MCALLVLASCSGPPTRTVTPAPAPVPAELDPESQLGQGVGATSSLAPASNEDAPQPAPVSVTARGLIAAAGPTGLRFLRPDGAQVGELTGDQIVIQPTWSRDGRRLVATVINPSSGAATVAVVDVSTWEVAASPANREYFFYSWSHDGTRLAALGPGPSGGTSLDILDDSGMVASDFSPESSSVFVAWEPGGRRLLVHAGPQLLLVGDPDSPREHTDFGSVGFGFQAPAWVPGTQDFLYVDSTGRSPVGGSEANPGESDLEGTVADGAPRLVRRSVDSPELADLGDAAGLVLMSVHPEGRLAALSLLAAPPTSADPNGSAGSASGTQAAAVQASVDISDGAVWMVDLATGERSTVLDSTGFWLEWSHDGRQLLIASTTTRDPGGATLAWHIWDGQETRELARFIPTTAFVRDYLRFADQYVETPRLWSPDSDAIVFGANTVGLDTTAVARLDGIGGVRSLGVADVSFWSPASVDSPSTVPG